MSYFPNKGKVLTESSTSTPLNAGATFTGTGVDVSAFASVTIACKTDQDGTLYVDFSPDNTNWDSTLTYSVVANVNEVHRITITRQYCRLRFTNSSDTNQTFLRLQALLGDQTPLTSNLNTTLQTDSDSTTTKAVLLGQTDGGTYIYVPVTPEGHLEVALHAPRLPFGSIHTENLFPVEQRDAIYGISRLEQNIGSSGSGAVSAVDGSFVITTGATIYSQAFIQSRKRLRYRPGQGVVGRFTAIYDTPAALSYQVVGFGHAEDGVYFGYKNTDFGILYVNRGVREIQKLTVTTGAIAAGNVAVELNGTTFVVPVSGNSSANRTAYDIARYNYTNWLASAEDSTVYFVADAVGNKAGSFTLSGGPGTTAAGTFSEYRTGAAANEQFITQANWNGDTMDGTGPTGVTLDPSKGNVFQIGIQYLGQGAITFDIETVTAGNNADWTTVHTLLIPNALSASSLRNPSLPFTAAVYSAGSTTPLSAKVTSYAGFIEGQKVGTGPRFTIDNSVTPVNGVDVPIFTIQNSRVFGGIANQSPVNITGLTCAAKYGNPTIFKLVKNAQLIGNPNFARFSTDSCSLYDTTSTGVAYTQEQVVWSGALGETGSIVEDFANVLEQITIQPGEQMTFLIRGVGSAGASPLGLGAITLREDH